MQLRGRFACPGVLHLAPTLSWVESSSSTLRRTRLARNAISKYTRSLPSMVITKKRLSEKKRPGQSASRSLRAKALRSAPHIFESFGHAVSELTGHSKPDATSICLTGDISNVPMPGKRLAMTSKQPKLAWSKKSQHRLMGFAKLTD